MRTVFCDEWDEKVGEPGSLVAKTSEVTNCTLTPLGGIGFRV